MHDAPTDKLTTSQVHMEDQPSGRGDESGAVDAAEDAMDAVEDSAQSLINETIGSVDDAEDVDQLLADINALDSPANVEAADTADASDTAAATHPTAPSDPSSPDSALPASTNQTPSATVHESSAPAEAAPQAGEVDALFDSEFDPVEAVLDDVFETKATLVDHGRSAEVSIREPAPEPIAEPEPSAGDDSDVVATDEQADAAEDAAAAEPEVVPDDGTASAGLSWDDASEASAAEPAASDDVDDSSEAVAAARADGDAPDEGESDRADAQDAVEVADANADSTADVDAAVDADADSETDAAAESAAAQQMAAGAEPEPEPEPEPVEEDSTADAEDGASAEAEQALPESAADAEDEADSERVDAEAAPTARARWRDVLVTVEPKARSVMVAMNKPLTKLPASVRPMVDYLALTLIMWVPIVWAIVWLVKQ